MNTNHLSNWEQEEYLLNQRTPQMVRHLAECSACRDAIAYLEQSIGMFRATAVEYSAQSLAGRPHGRLSTVRGSAPVVSLRWAFAALLPLLLLVFALLPLRIPTSKPAHPDALVSNQVSHEVSDAALLDEVDQQLSVTVPSSMESLTHLVTADNRHEGASSLVRPGVRSKPIAQSN